MKTVICSKDKEVVIGDGQPTIIIGERLNPTGKTKMVKALREKNFDYLHQEAIKQINNGAHVLDVNVCVPGLDEGGLLAQVVSFLKNKVKVPFCLDSDNPRTLEAALTVYEGKPLINSVTGQEQSLNEVLPLVKKYKAAVIGLTIDDRGIPQEPQKRLEIALKIVNRAEMMGIPREDIIIDSLTLAIATDKDSALKTLETIKMIKEEIGVNQVLGVSNISFGLPLRHILNEAFISMVLSMGITCLIANPSQVRQSVLACDLLLGKDRFARNFIKSFREMK